MANLNTVISLLKNNMPTFIIVESILANLDADNEGWDDEAAEKARQIREFTTGLIALIPQNTSGVARGYEGIKLFGDGVINGLVTLRDRTSNSQMPYAERVRTAEELAATLGDKTKVFQPRSGNDKTLLENFKKDAAAIVQQIRDDSEPTR